MMMKKVFSPSLVYHPTRWYNLQDAIAGLIDPCDPSYKLIELNTFNAEVEHYCDDGVEIMHFRYWGNSKYYSNYPVDVATWIERVIALPFSIGDRVTVIATGETGKVMNYSTYLVGCKPWVVLTDSFRVKSFDAEELQ